jgi:hypothetical protein
LRATGIGQLSFVEFELHAASVAKINRITSATSHSRHQPYVARRANLSQPPVIAEKQKQCHIPRCPASAAEGRIAIVTDVGSGMRWTRSDRQTCDLRLRTAKPCGPGAPGLVLSLRDVLADDGD